MERTPYVQSGQTFPSLDYRKEMLTLELTSKRRRRKERRNPFCGYGRLVDYHIQNHSNELIVSAGDGKDDFVIVDPKTGGLTLYKSGGQQPNGHWGWIPVEGQIATGLGGPGKAIRLADMNGDGKADYIQLGENGEAKLYLNNGQQSGGGWGWAPYNDFNNIADGIGFTRDHVQFKDIDGDRRADYIGVDQLDGHTVVYKNLGPQPAGHW